MVKNSIKAGYQTVEYLGKEIQIPKDWEKTEQRNVCEFINGYAFSESEFTNYGYLIIRIQNLMGGKNFLYSNVKLPEKQFAIKGDLLFTWSATFSPFIWDGEKSAFHYHQWKVIPKPLNDKMFLYYHLEQVASIIKHMGQSGLGMFHMTKAGMEKFPILKPKELHEQEKIVKILTDINKLIEKSENQILKKKNIKQGAMQELLTGKRRLEGFNEKWILKKLGNVLKVKHGKSQKEIIDENGQYPILATGGKIGMTSKFLYNKPSALIGRKGTIDKPQYMDTPFWTVDTLFYTEMSKDIVPKFIFYKFMIIDWYSYNEASGVPSLNATTIEKIEQLFPPSKKEQEAIVKILSDMDLEIKELETKRDKYIMIKNGMMQKLLTGEIRLV